MNGESLERDGIFTIPVGPWMPSSMQSEHLDILVPSATTTTLGFPYMLPHDDEPIPYFIVGDDAFPLGSQLLKPFSHCRMAYPERRVAKFRVI